MRKAFYEIDARELGQDVAVVRAQFAKAFRDKAQGIWVQESKAGGWEWVKK